MAAMLTTSSDPELSDKDPEKIHTNKDLEYSISSLRKELESVLDQLSTHNYTVNLTFSSPTPALSNSIFICTLEWDGSEVEAPFEPLPLTQVLISPQCSSKSTAKAFITLQLLQMLPERRMKLSHGKKTLHSADASRGPLEVLNEMIQQHPYQYQYKCYTEGRGINQRFKGRLTFLDCGRTIIVDYPYHKDYRYCKNKLARKVLEKASFYDENIWDCYNTIRKYNSFVLGRVFPLEEDIVVELKGGRVASIPMTEDAVVNLRTEIGKQVCAFLNTEGGSIFIGIHDEQRIIQGIEIKNSDKFKLQMNSSINERLEPYRQEQVRFHLHQVKKYNDKNCTLETTLSRPAVPDEYHLHLEGRIVALEHHIESLPQESVEGKLWVMEVSVSKSDELTFFDGKAYKRDNGAVRDMPVPEIKQRIIDDYKRTHNTPVLRSVHRMLFILNYLLMETIGGLISF